MDGFISLVGRINIRHMFERRLRTSLTVLGVAAGVALVTSVAIVNATLLSTARASAQQLGGAAEIEVAGADRTGLPQRATTTVAGTDGVDQVIPVMRTYTTLATEKGSLRVLILGVTQDFSLLFPQGLGELGEIELSGGFGTRGGLVLSRSALEKLGVKDGSRISIETPRGYADVEVTGTVSGGPLVAFNGGDVGAMALPAAQETFGRTGRVDSIYVIVDRGASVDDVEAAIEGRLRAGAIVGPPAERVEGFDDALNAIATLTSTAGTVALFVSAFVVFNTMSMSIAERRREVSMVFAFGATRRQVLGAFLGEAAVLGVVASVLGLGIGFLLARAVVGRALEGMRVFAIDVGGSAVVEPEHVVLGLLSGLVVSLLGTFVPARRVLNIAPVESLKPQGIYEPRSSDARGWRRTAATVLGAILVVGGAALAIITSRTPGAAWLSNGALMVSLVGATLMLPVFVSFGVRVLRLLLLRNLGATARLATDALLRSASRTTITTGALVFTLGIVVGAGSALDSFQSQWRRSSSLWYGAPVNVNAASYVTLGSDQPLPIEAEEVLEDVDGVQATYPDRYRVVNVDGRQTTMYIVPYAEQARDGANLTPEGESFRANIAEHLAAGEIVISRFMADRNDLRIGDEIVIPTPTGEHRFTVGDVVYDLNPLDSLYMGSETFLQHWRDPSVDRFEIALEPGAEPAAVMAGLRRAIDEEGLSAEVVTRDQLIGDVFESIEANFSVARGIQIAALIVAALAIANTMFIAVLERRWELGLQRAIGMDRGQIRRTLLLEGGVIGIVGGAGAALFGLFLGFILVTDMEYTFAFAIPFEPSTYLVGLALLVGTVIAGVAGFYPSREAARMPIIESLRYE